MEDYGKFGRKISTLRKELELSQEEFAERCDLSSRHISTIENGKANPKLDTVLKICTVCGINTGELSELFEPEKNS